MKPTVCLTFSESQLAFSEKLFAVYRTAIRERESQNKEKQNILAFGKRSRFSQSNFLAAVYDLRCNWQILLRQSSA